MRLTSPAIASSRVVESHPSSRTCHRAVHGAVAAVAPTPPPSRHCHHHRRRATVTTGVAAGATAGRRLAVRPLSIAAPDRRCRLLRRRRRCGIAPPAALCLRRCGRHRRVRRPSLELLLESHRAAPGVRRVRDLAPRREPPLSVVPLLVLGVAGLLPLPSAAFTSTAAIRGPEPRRAAGSRRCLGSSPPLVVPPRARRILLPLTSLSLSSLFSPLFLSFFLF
ncbi:hypothetical protein Scep_008741 [Stephania cephalantha]|uniref:Uncharacterized protein n=1 Tax=Stephania cephalantha TaxID=152367 RepID=A0AAP0PFN9_9MAGN